MTWRSSRVTPWIAMFVIVLPAMILGIAYADSTLTTPREPFVHAMEAVATQIALGPILLAALVVAVHPLLTLSAFGDTAAARLWPSILTGASLGAVAGAVWLLVVPFGLGAVGVAALGGGAFGALAPARRAPKNPNPS